VTPVKADARPRKRLTPPVASWRRSYIYFPDEIASLTALSERAHRFVLRWVRSRRACGAAHTRYWRLGTISAALQLYGNKNFGTIEKCRRQLKRYADEGRIDPTTRKGSGGDEIAYSPVRVPDTVPDEWIEA
jgi:hypothetical protein